MDTPPRIELLPPDTPEALAALNAVAETIGRAIELGDVLNTALDQVLATLYEIGIGRPKPRRAASGSGASTRWCGTAASSSFRRRGGRPGCT